MPGLNLWRQDARASYQTPLPASEGLECGSRRKFEAYLVTHEIQDFETDVIARSQETPVLVDFWAEWCGPCRSLGPVLEKLENESNGSWALAKVDVDSNREIATTYRVQGIPAVKLFVEGKVVAEFTGALPESQVKHWLDTNLPSEEKALLTGAIEMVQRGEHENAQVALETIVQTEPAGGHAHVLLAQVLVFREPDKALELVDGVGAASDHFDIANDVRTLAGLLAHDLPSLPEDVARDDYIAAIQSLRLNAFDAALEKFIAVLGRNKDYDDGGARRACIALFNYLGRDHPLSGKYRRPFQSALN